MVKYPKYKIKQVVPKVFLVTFNSAYDLAMTFLRSQEYYESPKWKGKSFTLLEYMEWYAKTAGKGAFTYPKDYNGFNLPSRILREVPVPDRNHYDMVMANIVAEIETDFNCHFQDYYIIGVSKERGDKSTINHEIAHGLYTTNSIYREQVNILIKQLPATVRKKLFKALSKRQYNKSVFVDETNAYLSTGFHHTWKLKSLEKYRKPFKILLEAVKESV